MWTVLLVEDEVFVRESVREIISWEELGFRVIGESGNGEEALELIRRDRPDLVLSDIVMPGLDGLELLKTARAEGVRSKFVMLTCMGEFEYVRQAMEYGASNYILKLSMSVNSLRDTLRKVGAELSAERAAESGEARGNGAAAGPEGRAAGSADISQAPEPAACGSGAPDASSRGLSGAAAALEAPVGPREPEDAFRLQREDEIAHPEVRRIVEYIHANYETDITVKSMSRYVMMGENYVSALFKKKTGRTLIHYLHGVRIARASDYLRQTALPVHEIGQRVGFANDNYFIKIFKRLTGLTPSQYRGREQEGARREASAAERRS
ncbi:response regulator [Saccharibacillus sp. CPCC 101409]|uniref:response regulator n=1 Tax=Saccharibacillus sp. CPCC 101409 TaxID=3058041 RepID=UPI002673AE5C|nr:response regulator [Saccharibacillus sp. CPCC 101409]MDO3411185.1 response regulator [Saccharibacillus sp. CPCC 101409]